MKRIIYFVLALSLIVAISCDRGPSTADLMIGTWELDSVYADGVKIDYWLYETLELNSDRSFMRARIGKEDNFAHQFGGEWRVRGQIFDLDFDNNAEIIDDKIIINFDETYRLKKVDATRLFLEFDCDPPCTIAFDTYADQLTKYYHRVNP